MDSFVTDTQALVKFMMGQKVINDRSHQAFLSADKGRHEFPSIFSSTTEALKKLRNLLSQ